MERWINELRMIYRTYMVEMDVEYVSGLQNMLMQFICKFTYCFYSFFNFNNDFVYSGFHNIVNDVFPWFWDQIAQYATLVDTNNNHFEVLVERNSQGIYLTNDWHAMRDFYKIQFDSWITIVFMGNGRFNIRIKNRWGKRIRYPTFTPPMKFRVERNAVQVTPDWFVPRPFMNDELNFQLMLHLTLYWTLLTFFFQLMLHLTLFKNIKFNVIVDCFHFSEYHICSLLKF